MSEEKVLADGLRELFLQRERFIILGLTGRTGSGCSTAASILALKKSGQLNLRESKNPPPDHEERKHRIIREWTTKKWNGFTLIRISDVICSFLVQEEFTNFQAYSVQLSIPENVISTVRPHFEKLRSKSHQMERVLDDFSSSSNEEVSAAYDFFFSEVPSNAKTIKSLLSKRTTSDYTRLFQSLGDNIRCSGGALDSAKNPARLFSLPEKINRLIKLARRHNSLNGNADYFVLDAIRHPYEARFFRERYGAFYLVAVSTSELERKARLQNINMRKEEIEALDQKEYPRENKPLSGYARFVSQNIQDCIEDADIHIRNDESAIGENYHQLTEQLVRYVSLIQHPGLFTPTRMERCMQAAFGAKVNSGCISRQVGAVVTDSNFSIKAIGWNEAPQGQVPCVLRSANHLLNGLDQSAFSKFEKEDTEFRKLLGKKKIVLMNERDRDGRNASFCFKDAYNELRNDRNQVHTRSLHAEENAFLQIAKYGGIGLEGGHLFTTASPCELCAKKAYQLGISSIYYVDPYPGISRDHVLGVGVQKPELVQFSGAIGRAYHHLYEPLMPFKDELEALVSVRA